MGLIACSSKLTQKKFKRMVAETRTSNVSCDVKWITATMLFFL